MANPQPVLRASRLGRKREGARRVRIVYHGGMIETDGNKGRGALSRMAAQVRAHPFAAATTGFACAYTVAIVFFYYDWLFELPGTDPFLYELALNGSLCVTAAVMFAVSRKRVVPRVGAAVSGGVLYAAALACGRCAARHLPAGADWPAPLDILSEQTETERIQEI